MILPLLNLKLPIFSVLFSFSIQHGPVLFAFHNPKVDIILILLFTWKKKFIPTKSSRLIKFFDCFLLYCLSLISAFSAFQKTSVITVSASVIQTTRRYSANLSGVKLFFLFLFIKSWIQIKYSLYLKYRIKL